MLAEASLEAAGVVASDKVEAPRVRDVRQFDAAFEPRAICGQKAHDVQKFTCKSNEIRVWCVYCYMGRNGRPRITLYFSCRETELHRAVIHYFFLMIPLPYLQ